jgi:cold shock CspA family protein
MIDQGSVKGPGMAAITQTTPTLAISPEKICFLIVKAREFDVKDVLTDPDTGSNPTDDSMLSVLEDHADDPVLSELRSAINDLNEDEQIDLVALTWLQPADRCLPARHATAVRLPRGRSRAVRHLLRGVGKATSLTGAIAEQFMPTPVRVEFQGLEPTPALRAHVQRHLANLEAQCGPTKTCRVVLKAPGRHRGNGVTYKVAIRLSLPDGTEIYAVGPSRAELDQDSLGPLVQEAFARARRGLQDCRHETVCTATRRQGRYMGIVLRFDGDCGFIEATNGSEIYFHRRSVAEDALERLKVGSRVAFDTEGRSGRQAHNVHMLDRHRLH